MNHVQALLAYESALVKARAARTKDAALTIIDQWARAQLRDRRLKVDDPMIEKVMDLYESGEHVAEIADKTGLSTATVRRIVAGSGRYTRKR